jgi:hypothetical protein
LCVGIRLLVVVHVPAERDPEFVNEILADFRFLIIRRDVAPFAESNVATSF